ncbi:MAG TPA: hypothetical protein VG389_09205 [Myxococcota bacterium]|nr:hypothetical protein [Myxococcota bacterium]
MRAGSRRGPGRPRLPDPEKRLVARLRARYESGDSLVSTDNRYLWKVARALFGGWEKALRAAGVPPPAPGRPPNDARRPRRAGPAYRAAPRPAGPAHPVPRGPVPAGTCAHCGERPNDLERHLRIEHHVDPRIYEAFHGPVPPARWSFSSVVAALRAHLAKGGQATETDVARRRPGLLRGVRLFFHDWATAFALAGPAAPLPASQKSKSSRKGV